MAEVIVTSDGNRITPGTKRVQMSGPFFENKGFQSSVGTYAALKATVKVPVSLINAGGKIGQAVLDKIGTDFERFCYTELPQKLLEPRYTDLISEGVNTPGVARSVTINKPSSGKAFQGGASNNGRSSFLRAEVSFRSPYAYVIEHGRKPHGKIGRFGEGGAGLRGTFSGQGVPPTWDSAGNTAYGYQLAQWVRTKANSLVSHSLLDRLIQQKVMQNEKTQAIKDNRRQKISNLKHSIAANVLPQGGPAYKAHAWDEKAPWERGMVDAVTDSKQSSRKNREFKKSVNAATHEEINAEQMAHPGLARLAEAKVKLSGSEYALALGAAQRMSKRGVSYNLPGGVNAGAITVGQYIFAKQVARGITRNTGKKFPAMALLLGHGNKPSWISMHYNPALLEASMMRSAIFGAALKIAEKGIQAKPFMGKYGAQIGTDIKAFFDGQDYGKAVKKALSPTPSSPSMSAEEYDAQQEAMWRAYDAKMAPRIAAERPAPARDMSQDDTFEAGVARGNAHHFTHAFSGKNEGRVGMNLDQFKEITGVDLHHEHELRGTLIKSGMITTMMAVQPYQVNKGPQYHNFIKP